MTIPVRNIYYLYLYAWGLFKYGDAVAIGTDDSPDLPNLLASAIVRSTQRLLRRGIDRGYLSFSEETTSPRGKIDIPNSMKRQSWLRAQLICQVEELTINVLHNQILKSTVVFLLNNASVKRSTREQLHAVASRLHLVDQIRLTADVFHRVQLSRNTSEYKLLIRLCELIFHSFMPDQSGSRSKFYSVINDEDQMSRLFEEFLRSFYRQELSGYSCAGEIMHWDATSTVERDLAFLPVMKTDLTLRSASRTIVVDAKCYKDILGGGQFSSKIRSGHLYQLATYLSHAHRAAPQDDLSGVLLYPANGFSVRLRYRLLGFDVCIASIDLAAEWREIHDELLGLINFINIPTAPDKTWLIS